MQQTLEKIMSKRTLTLSSFSPAKSLDLWTLSPCILSFCKSGVQLQTSDILVCPGRRRLERHKKEPPSFHTIWTWYDLGQVTFLNLSLLICKMGTGQSGGDWDNIHTLGRLGAQHMVRCTQAQKMASIQYIQDPSHNKHCAGLLRAGK